MPVTMIKQFQQRLEHGFWHFFLNHAVCLTALTACLMVAVQF
jgi:hypothetical protein